MDYQLQQRRIVVTGASRGIGCATARILSREGAQVALVGRNAAALQSIASDLGPSAVALPWDLSQTAQVGALATAAAAQLGGPVDGAVICHASFLPMSKLHSVAQSDMHTALTTDLQATWLLLQALLPDMMAQRFGRIVLVSSVCGEVGQGKAPLYCSIKAGLEGLARNLAIDFSRFGITTNVVAPGVVSTERLDARGDAAHQENLRQRIPSRALATPAQIAEVIAFFCSHAAGYVSGATLPISGGAHLSAHW